MNQNNYVIKYNDGNICFYFLEKNDSLLNIEIKNNNNAFGSALFNFLQQKNNISCGLPVETATIDEIASFIVKMILTENGDIYNLKVKNNEVLAYFYTISEFDRILPNTYDLTRVKKTTFVAVQFF